MTRARDTARLVNPNQFTVDAANNRVGLGSETPDAKLDVAGIVSATAYYGDGSNLEGVASAGLGTAISDSGALSVIYYTDNTLTVGDDTTVDVPAASDSNVAYTLYAEIAEVIESFFYDVGILDVPIENSINNDGPIKPKQKEINNLNNFKICPSCSNQTLKIENGCDTCVQCGYSKCDK